MMGPTRRTPLVVFISFLQIQALKGIKTTFVTGTEGQMFDIRCEYSTGQEKNAKYFQGVNDKESNDNKIQTNKQDEWERKGRFSAYDNTTGAFFIVRVDQLYLNDSGRYWCGVKLCSLPDHISVIQLKVSEVIEIPASTNNRTTHKFTQQLLLIALLCVAAMIFVCLFTIFLQLAVKQRSAPRKKRETSSDYETMMPGVKTEPECCCCCSHPDCINGSALPRPPADLCSNFSPKNREPTVSFSCGDYVDVDVPGHVCQYQHLDVSQLDEDVYHSVHGNSCPKQISHS